MKKLESFIQIENNMNYGMRKKKWINGRGVNRKVGSLTVDFYIVNKSDVSICDACHFLFTSRNSKSQKGNSRCALHFHEYADNVQLTFTWGRNGTVIPLQVGGGQGGEGVQG